MCETSTNNYFKRYKINIPPSFPLPQLSVGAMKTTSNKCIPDLNES